MAVKMDPEKGEVCVCVCVKFGFLSKYVVIVKWNQNVVQYLLWP